MSIAISARIRTPIRAIGDVALRAIIPATFVPKQLDSPAVDTSHCVALFSTHTENASVAVTARPMMVSPAPATTTRVRSDCSNSLPGFARCSHAMRIPATITDTTAMAPTYHHSEFCKKPTADAEPSGAVFGSRPATSVVPPEMRMTAPRTMPSRPSSCPPSPRRRQMTSMAPTAMIDMTQIANAIHCTYPRIVVTPAVPGGVPPPASPVPLVSTGDGR